MSWWIHRCSSTDTLIEVWRLGAIGLAVVLASGCSLLFETGSDDQDAGAASEDTDTLADAGGFDATVLCATEVPLNPCSVILTRPSLDLDGSFIADTEDGLFINVNGGGEPGMLGERTLGSQTVSVLEVSALTLQPGAVIRAVGERPFAIVSRGNIIINGLIDIAGAGTLAPAGTGLGDCDAQEGIVHPSLNTSSGGGGGGFGGSGGAGGAFESTSGGEGGASNTSPETGGCPGANGGAPGVGGTGGVGGGAILLFSGGEVVLGGSGSETTISANGAGGTGGVRNVAPIDETGGGAGGGSGGLIRIEARRIVVGASAALVAKGGGGGGGTTDLVLGGPGASGDRTAEPSVGGLSASLRHGGDGGALSGSAGIDAIAALGSGGRSPGGGGGGAGVIILGGEVEVIQGSVIAPAPVLNP